MTFFKPEKEDISTYPIYHEYPIPEDFATATWNQLIAMTNDDFHVFMERIRVWMLEMYHVHKVNTVLSPKSVEEIKSGFKKFASMDVSKYYDCKNGVKVLYGSSNKWTSGLNNWFPEMIGVEIGHAHPKSVIDLLSREEYYHRMVDKLIIEDALTNFRKIPDKPFFRPFRKMLTIARGTQVAANFPTHVAKWLHLNHLQQWKDKELYVYDPCMGWAARMISLFAASTHISLCKKKIHLIGTDVNTEVHERFDRLYRFWDKYVGSLKNITVKKFIIPAEDMNQVPEFTTLFGKGHLAFTSPPYYNKEMYSQDETQSYIRYKKYPEWRDGFLIGMMKNTYDFLRPEGVFLLNVANTLPKKDGSFTAPIENDSIEIGKEIGFEYKGRYNLLLSLLVGKSSRSNKSIIEIDGVDWRCEPIHIFVKK